MIGKPWIAAVVLTALLSLSVPAAARDPESVSVAVDKAYLLIRYPATQSYALPIFVRILEPEELAAYQAARDAAFAKYQAKPDKRPPFRFTYKHEPNVLAPGNRTRIEKRDEEWTFLIPVKPGSYLLAAISSGGFLGTCLCMGTVRFDARPGTITDLGRIFVQNAFTPLLYPELEGYAGRTTGSVALSPPQFAATVRPATADMIVPEILKGQPIVRAEYRAAPKMPNYFGGRITRLAPVPGVLAYRDDQVIDARTGEAAR